MSFSGSTKGTPHDWCRRTMKKNTILQWKPMELGGDPQKKWIHMFTGDLYSMYVVLQGIGFLSCIRVYIISVNSPWQVATLDVWSS